MTRRKQHMAELVEVASNLKFPEGEFAKPNHLSA